MELLFSLLMIAVVTAVIALGAQAKAARLARIAAFKHTLERGQGKTALSWAEGLASAWVRGWIDELEVSLSFERRGAGKHKYHVAIFEVPVEHSPGDFELEAPSVWRDLGAMFGLVDEPERIPGAGGLAVEGGTAARRLVQQAAVTAALGRLRAAGARRVWLRDGTLGTELRVNDEVLEPRALRAVFTHLGEVARACRRRELKIEVKDRARAPRFAWTGGGEVALCPYCRDEVAPESEAAADCDACGTVHHRECLAEAGGCTVFGCAAGRPRERA